MIEFIYKSEFRLDNESKYQTWIERVITSEEKVLGDVFYTFCEDDILDKINRKYLGHEDLTDIISFDSCIGNIVSGEIFISVERVEDNASIYGTAFQEELLRVMAHGLLHFFGFKDGSQDEADLMRVKEKEKMEMFHVEHFE